nr:PhzF family phenazine biosynthesis protein [Alicycliphilus denitrificans]
MPPKKRPFMQVDVFSPTPYLGNPLAVVLHGEGLADAEMQRFARWTNLSETTFLLPPTQPGADYRVRIFTPGGELPFAGHPTLGSCHAWLATGGQPRQPGRVVQECAKGLVPLRVDAQGALAFAAPPSLRRPITEEQLAPVLRALGLERGDVRACQQLDNGPNFWALLLDDPDRLLALQPDLATLHALGVEVGLAALYPRPPVALIGRASREARAFAQAGPSSPAQPDLEVRVFFRTGATVREDPITGSFNASLAQWLLDEGHIQAPYRASQGVALGMEGLVQVEQEGATVWVGGHVAPCVHGEVWL